jgi:hypothetical protein
MPWAKFGYERIRTVYSKAFLEIWKKKSENVFIPEREMLIRGEILKRDFTKRQMKIISMILTLSCYIGKEKAIIPKMQDFELAGISKIKIRNELTQLVGMNVIEWNEEENTFSIKDPREWKAKYHSGYNDPRAQELFILNLKDMGIKFNEE